MDLNPAKNLGCFQSHLHPSANMTRPSDVELPRCGVMKSVRPILVTKSTEWSAKTRSRKLQLDLFDLDPESKEEGHLDVDLDLYQLEDDST